MMGTMDTPCAFQLIPAGKIILLVAVVDIGVEIDAVVIALVHVVVNVVGVVDIDIVIVVLQNVHVFNAFVVISVVVVYIANILNIVNTFNYIIANYRWCRCHCCCF